MTDRPAAPMVYSYRRGAFGNESGWTLGPSALVRAAVGAAARRMAYADVAELRLRFAPTVFDRRRFRCELRQVDGTRFVIRSTSYVSFGRFEDRGERYGPLVRELVARVAQAAPTCRFRTGQRPVAFWLRHIALLSALLMIAAAVAIVAGFPPAGAAAVKLGAIALYIPVAIFDARRNFPRTFSPGQIPPEVLP
jgi:hypothetical protein